MLPCGRLLSTDFVVIGPNRCWIACVTANCVSKS